MDQLMLQREERHERYAVQGNRMTQARSLVRELVLALVLAIVAFTMLRQTVAAAIPVVIDQRIEGADDLTVGDRFRYVIKLEPNRYYRQLAPGGLPQVLALTRSPRCGLASRAGAALRYPDDRGRGVRARPAGPAAIASGYRGRAAHRSDRDAPRRLVVRACCRPPHLTA